MQVSLTGAGNMHAASRALKRAGGRTRAEFTKAMKDAATPTLKKVKAAARTMNIRGFRTRSPDRFTAHGGRGGIRAKVARVTELDLSTGSGNPRARFIVHNERLGNAKNVPWHLDTGKVFRHPIMGNRSQWAGSRGQPWFYTNIRQAPFVEEVDKAIDRIVTIAEKG